jgi:predicted metal-dependent peptidase
MTNTNGMNRIVKDAQNLISDIRLGLGDTFTFADLLAHTEKSVRAEIIHLRLPLIGALNAFCYYDGDVDKFVIVTDKFITGVDLTHLCIHELVHIWRGHVDKRHPLTIDRITEALEKGEDLDLIGGIACYAQESHRVEREISVEIAAVRLEQHIRTVVEQRIAKTLGEWTS